MTKRIVIVSDLQVPFHDRKAAKAVIQFIGDTNPDEVVMIGDQIDLPQPSRWTKGTRGEFEGSIFKDSDYFKTNILQPLRDVYDGPIGAHEGNHDARAREYLEKNSPALSGTKAFHMETLLDFDGFGIELLPEVYEIAPGWVSTHGHRQGIRLSQIAGNTAMGAARKFNKSVVMGHTHRLGIISETRGYNGKPTSQLTGMEVGNLMNMALAGYLRGGAANWQQGFGLLTVDGQHVKPEIVEIKKGRFSVDGHVWEV
ncbi:hypothetical protein BKG71_19415 [Mycobacteroides chelonae]|uniref:metallophosphoesterase n=1 Tax=Mycobacteroides chelonae TaxID=1774 RepID=UPI0008AA4D3A|nr:metallophosphoesterase [Mycobacteroides chelonae]OHT98288.1 hypothetical protein BKG71_19415 [Mycobacteroides chelonae]